jgi:hypothetical protein
MFDTCAGCESLKLEGWPKGVKAARCFSKEQSGNIRPEGRTLEVSAVGIVAVPRPAWCPGKRGERK